MAAEATLQRVLTRFQARKVLTVGELARQMRWSRISKTRRT